MLGRKTNGETVKEHFERGWVIEVGKKPGKRPFEPNCGVFCFFALTSNMNWDRGEGPNRRPKGPEKRLAEKNHFRGMGWVGVGQGPGNEDNNVVGLGQKTAGAPIPSPDLV